MIVKTIVLDVFCEVKRVLKWYFIVVPAVITIMFVIVKITEFFR